MRLFPAMLQIASSSHAITLSPQPLPPGSQANQRLGRRHIRCDSKRRQICFQFDLGVAARGYRHAPYTQLQTDLNWL